MDHRLSIQYRLMPHAPEGQLQKKQPSDAGFDIKAAQDFIILPPDELPVSEETVLFCDGSQHRRRKYPRQLIPTGIQLAPEDLSFFLLMPRSGFSSDYLMLMRNTIGLIDFEYRGELLISVYALSHAIPIARGERIAQLVPLRQSPVDLFRVDELIGSQRGENGFGSSGH